MAAPGPLQIREANAHLAALHRRAAELEARLQAAEGIVRAQAERLARHDQQLFAALDELGSAKDREIAALREELEATQAAVQQRDRLIGQLRPRAQLLQDLIRLRPPLAELLAALLEAECLEPPPILNTLTNSTGEQAATGEPLQPMGLGTTV